MGSKVSARTAALCIAFPVLAAGCGGSKPGTSAIARQHAKQDNRAEQTALRAEQAQIEFGLEMATAAVQPVALQLADHDAMVKRFNERFALTRHPDRTAASRLAGRIAHAERQLAAAARHALPKITEARSRFEASEKNDPAATEAADALAGYRRFLRSLLTRPQLSMVRHRIWRATTPADLAPLQAANARAEAARTALLTRRASSASGRSGG